MEKFDKHIKTKLDERRLVPSEEVWDKINEGLPTGQKSKRRGRYAWGIAASLVGIVLLSVILNQNVKTNPQPNTAVEKTNPKTILESEPTDLKKTGVANRDMKELEENKLLVNAEEKSFAEERSYEQGVVENGVLENNPNSPLKDAPIEKSLDIISMKANEVLAQVALLESESANLVTDKEVDSLLRAAQKEILADKLFVSGGKVDAMALLTEVEDELDESFRDQIFEALKEGYLKLRSGVADRNK